MKQLMRVCDCCGHKLILERWIWQKEEWANGKHFQIRHSECGGSYRATVSELVQRVTKED